MRPAKWCCACICHRCWLWAAGMEAAQRRTCVVNMERTNVRYLEADSLPEKVDVVTIDVAFISLDKVLPAVKKIIADDGIVIAKPVRKM